MMLDNAVAFARPSCMGTTTFLRRHQSNQTHGPARGPVDWRSGHETLDDAVDTSIIDDALRALSITCTMAMVSAASRTSAPAALEAIRASFAAAHHLRNSLASVGDDLLTGGVQRVGAIADSLDESFNALEAATNSLQRHHGLAHMADIIEQGNADEASRKLFTKAVASHPPVVHDEATAAGVQSLREMVGPLNEIQIGLATVRRAAMGRNIDNEPF